MEFKVWLEDQEKEQAKELPNVLWITGMNSSGMKPKKLALLGYNVKSVGTTTNYFAAYLGRFKRYHPFFTKTIADIGSKHIDKNIEKHDEEVKDFKPDVVVGTSQGGAVAVELGDKYPKSKFVLVSPAWKIFNAKPSGLPKDTIVIHGKKDVTVPIEDSIELADQYGFELKVYDYGHNDIPFGVIRLAIDQQLNRLGKSPTH